jgi:hypothetical protein
MDKRGEAAKTRLILNNKGEDTMMTNMKRILTALLLATSVYGQTVQVDRQTTTATDLNLYVQDQGEIGIEFREGRNPVELIGEIVFWWGTNGVRSTEVVAITNVITNATSRFMLPYTFANFSMESPGRTAFTYGVEVDGKMLGDGRLYIKHRPGLDNQVPDFISRRFVGPVDWSLVTSYANTWDDGPYQFGVGFTYTTNEFGQVEVQSTAVAPTFELIQGDPYDNEALSNALASVTAVETDPVFTNWLAGATFFTPSGLATDYSADWTTLTNAIADATQEDYATFTNLASTALQSGDNVSELVNDAGYVTGTPWTGEGYLTNEVDTLQSVTARGATTTDIITVADVVAGTASLTNAAALASGALQRSGGTMTGDLIFGTAVKLTSTVSTFDMRTQPSGATFFLHDNGQSAFFDPYNDPVLGIFNGASILYATSSNGIWRSEGTATNTTQIVNFQTLTNNLAAYVQTNAIGTMAAQDATNYYTIAETDAEILSPTITPTTTGASINISDLTEYYNVAPAGAVTVTLSPALTGQAQFLYLEYGAQNIEFPGNTTLGHFSWDEGFGDGPSAAAGVAGFYSTSYSTNWLGRWREF